MFLRPWFDRTLNHFRQWFIVQKCICSICWMHQFCVATSFTQPSIYRNAYIYFWIFYHPHINSSISHNDNVCINNMFKILSTQTWISDESQEMWFMSGGFSRFPISTHAKKKQMQWIIYALAFSLQILLDRIYSGTRYASAFKY